jgi:hypothetical protein
MSLIAEAAWLYVAVAIGMALLALVAARLPYRWVAGSVAMVAALPRFLTYEISFLLVGAARPDRPKPEPRP